MPKSVWLCEHCGQVFTTAEACTTHEATEHRPLSVEERLANLEALVLELQRRQQQQPVIFQTGPCMPQWISQGPVGTPKQTPAGTWPTILPPEVTC